MYYYIASSCLQIKLSEFPKLVRAADPALYLFTDNGRSAIETIDTNLNSLTLFDQLLPLSQKSRRC